MINVLNTYEKNIKKIKEKYGLKNDIINLINGNKIDYQAIDELLLMDLITEVTDGLNKENF